MKIVRVSNLTDEGRLATRTARELKDDANLIWAGEGHYVESVMGGAAARLAVLCPNARYLVAERAGRRIALWWAIEGKRDPVAAAFTTERWPSLARRRQAAAVRTPAVARTREKS